MPLGRPWLANDSEGRRQILAQRRPWNTAHQAESCTTFFAKLYGINSSGLKFPSHLATLLALAQILTMILLLSFFTFKEFTYFAAIIVVLGTMKVLVSASHASLRTQGATPILGALSESAALGRDRCAQGVRAGLCPGERGTNGASKSMNRCRGSGRKPVPKLRSCPLTEQ
ncbi:hypothetical protein MC885_018800 [Smutsia gigantea]|nr:hypothetical protein MC885_018800 [Smutsia gigantea]